MSQVLVQQYLNNLQDLRKVSALIASQWFVKRSKIS